MSPQSVQEGSVPKPSPAESELPDLYVLLSETTEMTGKAAFWIGILIGLWFIIGAYDTNRAVSAIESVDELIPEWYDWVWIGLSGLGMAISFAACAHLMGLRRPGDPPYDVLAAVGGAVSLAIIVVMLFEHIASIHDLISSGGGVLWPEGKPLWFMPLSTLGIALPMVALILARKDAPKDEALGIFFSCAPTIVLSLPFLLGLDKTDMVRWIPTLYFVSGAGLMLAGLKPFERSSKIMLDSTEYVAPRTFAVVLVFVGIFSWFEVSVNDPLSSSMDAVWILPLAVNLVMSVAMLLAINNAPAGEVAWTKRRGAACCPGTLLVLLVALVMSVVMSVLLLSLFTLGYLDALPYGPDDALYAFSLPRSLWLYPLSLLGATVVMIGVNLVSRGTAIDRVTGVLYAAAPVLVACAFVAFGSSALETVYPLLAGKDALVVYIVFAAALLLSGLKTETFIKMQLPVLREKSALNSKKYRQILRQVSRNVMGVIGLVILVVFIIIALIGPAIAPYKVDMTINGQFEGLLPESSAHLMGTDVFGHDVFSQLLYGAKTSITVGVVAAIISSFLGAAIGLYSGYVGGWKDEAIMRLNDIVLSIPWLVLMIIIAAFMGEIDLTGIILVIGLTGWSGTARLVRAQVLSLRERQYIERAKAIGSDDMHIIRRHILPNAFPLVFANTILTVAGSILAEATLSFLQLEPQGVVTWGTMLADAQEAGAFTIGLHWWIVAPGLCIVVVVLGFTLLGYALDDVMNPKLRKR